jgi:hypothetical protein
MMRASFLQQSNKESGMLRVIESRYGFAAHYDVVRISLVAAYDVDAVDARVRACYR